MNPATQRPRKRVSSSERRALRKLAKQRQAKLPPADPKFVYAPMKEQAAKPMTADERAAWAEFHGDRASMNAWRYDI